MFSTDNVLCNAYFFFLRPYCWWTVVAQIRLLDINACILNIRFGISTWTFVILSIVLNMTFLSIEKQDCKLKRNLIGNILISSLNVLQTCSSRNLFLLLRLLLLFPYDVLWALSHIVYTNRNPIYMHTRASERTMVACLSCG